jgi:preprotein translocase subunit YajC
MLDFLSNIYQRGLFVLNGAIDAGLPLPPGVVVTPAGDAAAPPVAPVPTPPEPGGFPWTIIVIYVALFAGIWFLFFRPQRKREKAMKEMQSKIGVGDNVVTTNGLFGKVADVGEDCFVVEFGTNRGVRIPVLKSDVVAIREPKMTPQPQA